MSTWCTSINEIMGLFVQSLRALIPLVEKARVPWCQPNAYDNWDQLSQSLFKFFVEDSILHCSEHQSDSFSLLKYDSRVKDYSRNSYICRLKDKSFAFVCFETEFDPCDTAVFCKLDSDGKVVSGPPFREKNCEFAVFENGLSRQIVYENLNVSL